MLPLLMLLPAANLGNMSSNPNDFVAAYFEKSASNESGITQARNDGCHALGPMR